MTVEIRFNLTKYGPTTVIDQNLVESKLVQCRFNSLGPPVCYDQVNVKTTFGSPKGTLISQSSEMLELFSRRPTQLLASWALEPSGKHLASLAYATPFAGHKCQSKPQHTSTPCRNSQQPNHQPIPWSGNNHGVSVSLEHHILFGCQYCRRSAISHSACK